MKRLCLLVLLFAAAGCVPAGAADSRDAVAVDLALATMASAPQPEPNDAEPPSARACPGGVCPATPRQPVPPGVAAPTRPRYPVMPTRRGVRRWRF